MKSTPLFETVTFWYSKTQAFKIWLLYITIVNLNGMFLVFKV